MKRKNIYTFLIPFVSLFLFIDNILNAQTLSGKVIYEVKLAEDRLYYSGELFFNDQQSLFKHKAYNEKKWLRDEGGVGNWQLEYTDNVGHIFLKKLMDSFILIRDFCYNKPLIYEDTITFNWVKTSDEKLIGKFICKKAITNFRGRIYTAWYCPEINVNAGPWKFYGLPGIILEISDQTNEIVINMISIQVNKNELNISLPILKDEKTTRKKFNLCLDLEWIKGIERNKALINNLQAEYPNITLNDGGGANPDRYQTATEKTND